jgi:hypothetical protein
MKVKSITTKENVEKCLPYVNKEYQSDFLELMQNIEILVSESLSVQEGQPNNEKIISGHTYKVTVLRTDFKSRAVYSFSYPNYDLDEINIKTEPSLCKVLSDVRRIYNEKDSHILREIFTDIEIMVLPCI